MDDFSRAHIDRFLDDLGGRESIAILSSLGEVGRCDTSEVEAGHAFVQRECKMKGFHTHAGIFPELSAVFTAHKQRSIQRKAMAHVPKEIKKMGRPAKCKATTLRDKVLERLSRDKVRHS